MRTAVAAPSPREGCGGDDRHGGDDRCVLRSDGQLPTVAAHRAPRRSHEFSRRRAPRSPPWRRNAAAAHRLPPRRPVPAGRGDPAVRPPHRAIGTPAVADEPPLQKRRGRMPRPVAGRAPSVQQRRSSSRSHLHCSRVRSRHLPACAVFRSSRARWSRSPRDPLDHPHRLADPGSERPLRNVRFPDRGFDRPHGVPGGSRASRSAIGFPRPARPGSRMEKCRARSTPPLRPRAVSSAFHDAGDLHRGSGSRDPCRGATRRRLVDRVLSSRAGRRDGRVVMAFEMRRRAASASCSRRTTSSRAARAALLLSTSRPAVMIGRERGQGEIRRP